MEKLKKSLASSKEAPLKPEELPFRYIISTNKKGPTLKELKEQNERERNKLKNTKEGKVKWIKIKNLIKSRLLR